MEDLILTDSAAHKVQTLIDDEGDDSLMLRVFISGGGCSGFQYGFTFDQETFFGASALGRRDAASGCYCARMSELRERLHG